MNDFLVWVNEQMEKRGWSNRELARRAGVSASTVSMALSGRNKVTYDFCVAIAEAFNIPPETVFRKAGLLRPNPNSDDIQHLIDIAKNLSDDQLKEVVNYAMYRYELQMREKRARYET